MPKVYDDDYEIIYSDTFNIYENKLIINEIAGFEFTFYFETDKETKETGLKIDGENVTKKIKITLKNFNNILGAGTTKQVKLIELEGGQAIYFSIFSKSLNETSFLQVTVTFYLR